jgi:hypothetical protein
MRLVRSKFWLVLAGALVLSACAQISPPSPAAVAQAEADDDAYCRSNGGEPGSNGYAACMKDRDAARSAQAARMDRTHQRLSDDMLNRR